MAILANAYLWAKIDRENVTTGRTPRQYGFVAITDGFKYAVFER